MLKENFLKALVAEDVGRGDLFSRISVAKQIRAYIIAKSDGVFAGQE
ncbi:nicotinate-nucleotide diphosphorylase (carboxylating), partial [cyanobacterium G8-9]